MDRFKHNDRYDDFLDRLSCQVDGFALVYFLIPLKNSLKRLTINTSVIENFPEKAVLFLSCYVRFLFLKVALYTFEEFVEKRLFKHFFKSIENLLHV